MNVPEIIKDRNLTGVLIWDSDQIRDNQPSWVYHVFNKHGQCIHYHCNTTRRRALYNCKRFMRRRNEYIPNL
jgi:hypothetical protein